jgi:hypothetical protein
MSEAKPLTYRLLVPHEKCEVWKPLCPKNIAKLEHLYPYFSGSKIAMKQNAGFDRDFEIPAALSITYVPLSPWVRQSRPGNRVMMECPESLIET